MFIPYPKTIRVDQGKEFISRDLDLWAYQRGVTLDFSRPGKPTGNVFIEAFNGRLRAEAKSAEGALSRTPSARTIARLMTVERDQLSKAESVTVAHAATIEAAIARAEKASGTTCEACGRRGRLRQTDLGYRYTACDDHVVD